MGVVSCLPFAVFSNIPSVCLTFSLAFLVWINWYCCFRSFIKKTRNQLFGIWQLNFVKLRWLWFYIFIEISLVLKFKLFSLWRLWDISYNWKTQNPIHAQQRRYQLEPHVITVSDKLPTHTHSIPFWIFLKKNQKNQKMESSIQPSSRANERTVGTSLGSPLRPTRQAKKVCAEKSQTTNKEKIKVYLQPSSIPTKFQTIHYDDSEDYGFNSTSQRFSTKMVWGGSVIMGGFQKLNFMWM
jgi:hypothetical protein